MITFHQKHTALWSFNVIRTERPYTIAYCAIHEVKVFRKLHSKTFPIWNVFCQASVSPAESSSCFRRMMHLFIRLVRLCSSCLLIHGITSCCWCGHPIPSPPVTYNTLECCSNINRPKQCLIEE